MPCSDYSINNRHFDGKKTYEHRDLHNLYGLLEISATYAGLKKRSDLRPFVLTRSFFCGAQKYAAVWTGDCTGSWDHFKLNLSILQNLCTAGMNFCGSDIPGFFGDPSDELFIRWYQAGTFFPFMRAHGHHKTKRREPWILPESVAGFVRKAIILRYRLLAYIYTTFYHFAYSRSWPIMMPLWMAFKDPKLVSIEEEYMFGPSLLVRPICSPEASVKVYLPSGEIWYDFWSGKIAPSGVEKDYLTSDLAHMPVYVKGGSILPLYIVHEGLKSAKELKTTPISLMIALNRDEEANGYLYLDDGETFKYEKGEYDSIKFEYKKNKLKGIVIHDMFKNTLSWERIIILGIRKNPVKVMLNKYGTKQVITGVQYSESREQVVILFKEELVSDFEMSIDF